MATINVARLNTLCKAFVRQLNDFLLTTEHFEKFAGVSKHLITNADSQHVRFYTKEFYVHVAYLFDIQDTLEFGRLRTDSQALIHNTYLEPSRLGCYMAVPHESDKALRLTACSHEGIQFWLNALEVILAYLHCVAASKLLLSL